MNSRVRTGTLPYNQLQVAIPAERGACGHVEGEGRSFPFNLAFGRIEPVRPDSDRA